MAMLPLLYCLYSTLTNLILWSIYLIQLELYLRLKQVTYFQLWEQWLKLMWESIQHDLVIYGKVFFYLFELHVTVKRKISVDFYKTRVIEQKTVTWNTCTHVLCETEKSIFCYSYSLEAQ